MKIGMTRVAVLAAALLLAPVSASAQFTWFDSEALFFEATQTTLVADFEDGPLGERGWSFDVGGVNIASYGGQAYIAWPGHAFFNPLPTSNVLTASGDEYFSFTLGAGEWNAFGFNWLSNYTGDMSVALYSPIGAWLGRLDVRNPANSYGFLGLLSDQTIGRVDVYTYGGNFENTAIDNLRLGTAAPPTNVVPEPISMVLLGTGLAGVAGAARRRRERVEAA